MPGSRSRKISVVTSPTLDIQPVQPVKFTENERSYINQYKDKDTKTKMHLVLNTKTNEKSLSYFRHHQICISVLHVEARTVVFFYKFQINSESKNVQFL